MQVRLFKPSVGEAELANIRQAFERGWIGLGPMVTEFEKRWAAFLGCQTSVACNSATAALHIALATFRFPPGAKVLVPSLTFSATASAALYNRLVPVFVDSDPATLGLSLEDLDRKYTPDCVAVMPVHYAGHPVPMDRLVPWARERGLKIIEDCAHTAGGIYQGRPLGRWGDIGCFSFEEKKCMTTGDGGMLVTDQPELLRDARAMRWVGIDRDTWRAAQKYVGGEADAMHWYYELRVLGWKYNMNDLAAAIGLAQLERLPDFNRRRSEIVRRYVEGLAGILQVRLLLPFEPDRYPYQMFGVRAERRNALMVFLKGQGVATGCHYTPLSLQPLFAEFGHNCPFIEREHESFVTLPLHVDLTDAEVDYVVDKVREFYRGSMPG